jgi:hypothetical protein
MRALVVVIMALGLAAPLASAEPAKAPSKKKTPVAAKKKAAKAATPASLGGVSLGNMAAQAAGSSADKADKTPTPNGARRLDLTPSRLFGKSDAPDRRGKEKHKGMSLGDDTSWQAQAVQVGAIAAGFAALVAICGNGNCLLPWGGGADNLGPPADLEIRPDNEPRPAR